MGMTRLEENKMAIEVITERAERQPTGTYEQMAVFQLGAIATMLADISKSLAIIADKAESEGQGVKCDNCLNARRIMSENGLHSICCLPEKIAMECLMEQAVAIHGVMELRDGLKQGMSREIGQHMLETAKGQSALIEILVTLRCIQAEASDEIVHPPILLLFIQEIELIIIGGYEMQSHSGIFHTGAEEIRHSAYIFHNACGVFEYVLVDPLQNILRTGIGGKLIGIVDMPVAKFFAGNRLSVQLKRIGRLFDFQHLHLIMKLTGSIRACLTVPLYHIIKKKAIIICALKQNWTLFRLFMNRFSKLFKNIL